jgi:hypothetical protein
LLLGLFKPGDSGFLILDTSTSFSVASPGIVFSLRQTGAKIPIKKERNHIVLESPPSNNTLPYKPESQKKKKKKNQHLLSSLFEQ